MCHWHQVLSSIFDSARGTSLRASGKLIVIDEIIISVGV